MIFDAVIIGSGAGGLSAAICLARKGQKVLVLEQHTVPGGWCHSFYSNGQRFSPGVHYLGQLGENQSTRMLYQGLGIANDLVFFEMNKKGYEHCRIGAERVDIPAGYEALNQVLSHRFPEEKKGLAKYLKAVKNVSSQLAVISEMDGFWDHLTIPWKTRHLGKYGLFSLKRVIDWHIKDPLLKKVLNIQCGDHGLPPGKASFPYHSAVMDHYSNGGFYPMGGGAAIVKAMTNAIKKYGGQVQTGQKVERILLSSGQKKQAVGVELSDGKRIYAKRIISNTDPGKTFLGLVGEENLSAKLLKQINATKYSCTSLMLFLTVAMDVSKAGFDSGNIWLVADKDSDEIYQDQLRPDIGAGLEFDSLFVSCSTLKDPTSFDGINHTIEIITFIGHESFNDFKSEQSRHSVEYENFKHRLTQKMITGLEKILPGVKDHIVHQELGTPLTNMHYIDSTNGCVYGTEKNFWQIGAFAFKPESEIENLYLCGASILANGVAGATYSGVQTAAKILGCTQAELLIPEEEQQLRVYDAEDTSQYPDWILKKMEQRKKNTARQRRQTSI